jgi:nicotinic acid mononucleotide adenylyltransferase
MNKLFRILSTREKALKINLDQSIYGSFAEIGAGQETAAQFFKVGGSSGTIAKTMSAYDMQFSDAIYGKSKRYVSQERLLMMLHHEFNLLKERLPDRLQSTKFFVFANTVETLNFKKTNQGHGWLGLRFQLEPEKPFNECIIHVLLHDTEANWQQQTMGILGINLIYACYHIANPEELMQALQDNLSPGRLEIDYFQIKGPDFANLDNRLMALKLVRYGLSRATMFDADGTVLQPADALYKKHVLLLRGRFRPVTLVHMDMLKAAQDAFAKEIKDELMVTFAELTLHNLSAEEGISDRDFLQRIDLLSSLGLKVMISDYQKYYMLADYIALLTHRKVRIVMGVDSMFKIFDESHYKELNGGLLESFGKLFKNNVKIMIYPGIKDNKLATCDDIKLPAQKQPLYKYLCQNNNIDKLNALNIDHLNIFSDKVLQMIRENKNGWQKYLPEKIAKTIAENKLFDYPG